MTFVSYAQNFEDVLLWRAFHDVEGGRYLDIGAQDPEVDSVSLAFYKAGWRGIHVEPTSSYAGRLREARTGEVVIQAVVTDAKGPVEFFEIHGTGISTGVADIAKRHRDAGFEPHKVFSPTIGLAELLQTFDGPVHWMKIDVEGMEADVLRSWGSSPVRPWVLLIEATAPGSQIQTHEAWIDEVTHRGYKQVCFDGLSGWFVHEDHMELAPRLTEPANVFDGFVVTRGHFSATALRSELDALGARLEDERGRTSELRAELRDTSHARNVEIEKSRNAARELALAQQEHRAVLEGWRSELRNAQLDRDVAMEEHREALRSLAEKEEEWRSSADGLWREFAARENVLQGELRESAIALATADALIRAAANERRGRWQRLGESLSLARPSSAIDALKQWRLTAGGAPNPELAPQSITMMTNMPQTDQRNPYLRANSLPELMGWNDLDFVRCAFVTVLGRQPDRQGEEYYVDRLRSGFSKYGILWQLRTSIEGRRHDPGIAGFDRELRKHHNARNRFYGWIVRIASGREADTPLERRLRAIENRLVSIPAIAAEISALANIVRAGPRSGNQSEPHSMEAEISAVRYRLSSAALKFYDRVYNL